jgi:hypothetical protein
VAEGRTPGEKGGWPWRVATLHAEARRVAMNAAVKDAGQPGGEVPTLGAGGAGDASDREGVGRHGTAVARTELG